VPHYVQKLILAIKKMAMKTWHAIIFLKLFITNPKTMGAITPSSRYLSQAMISPVFLSPRGKIVEFGPGTGVFTEMLIQSGIAPEKIIAIEYELLLVEKLKKRFPNIQIIRGNAACLTDLLAHDLKKIDTIISGLPLRSLPKKIVHDILTQVPLVLSDQGRLIQFTYDIRNRDDIFQNYGYRLIQSHIIWRNLPPAKVNVYVVDNIDSNSTDYQSVT